MKMWILRSAQIYPDEKPEENEEFYVELTSVVRLPSGAFDGTADRRTNKLIC